MYTPLSPSFHRPMTGTDTCPLTALISAKPWHLMPPHHRVERTVQSAPWFPGVSSALPDRLAADNQSALQLTHEITHIGSFSTAVPSSPSISPRYWASGTAAPRIGA